MPLLHTNFDSTSLRAASYDTEQERLDITFKSGADYTFRNVPLSVYEGLRDAHSPGQYFHQNIKNVYG